MSKLSDAKLRKIKPEAKAQKLSDGEGMHLYVSPAGSKTWRLKYRFAGKEKLLTIGQYPQIGLAAARAQRDAAKAALATGQDPGVLKKRQSALNAAEQENTFEAAARIWYDINKSQWTEKHGLDVWGSLEKEILPDLGQRPLGEISAREVLTCLRKVEARGANETARRIRQRMSAVFVFAIASDLCDNDPAAQVEKAMAPVKRRRQPAVTDLDACRQIIRDVDMQPAHPVTKLAHRILAMTAVRPGTLVSTPWDEWLQVDENPLWIVPAQRMKLRLHFKDDENRDHLVPLPRQCVDAITELYKLTGRGPLAFPNTRFAHKQMSENAIGYLLNRAGYHHRHVPHGWRSSFSTIMNERNPDDRAIIDFALGHVPKDKTEAAYNRALYLKQRADLFQTWSDLIMEDQIPLAELVKLPRKTQQYVVRKAPIC